MANLQYVMTLSGPRPKSVKLLGIFDPVTAHPIVALLGLAGGIFLGWRHLGKRRR